MLYKTIHCLSKNNKQKNRKKSIWWQKNTGLLVTFSRQKGVEKGMSGDTRVFFEYLTILNELVQKFTCVKLCDSVEIEL